MEERMEIRQCFLTNNDCYTTGRTIVPTGVMVHSTGANNTDLKRYVQPDDGLLGQNQNSNDWNRPGLDVCVHAFIGTDKNGDVRVYQTLPWNHRGWHAGGDANNTHISFEICEDDLTDADYFAKIYDTAAELCAYLCKEYGIDPLSGVICHSEGYTMGIASGHADVMHWFPKFGKNMDMFRAEVKKKMEDSKKTEEDDEMLSYEDFKKYMQQYEEERRQVAEPSWSAKEGFWNVAVSGGVVDGSAPEAYIKRDEVIAVLGRLGLLDVHETVTSIAETGDAHSNWAEQAIQVLLDAGIINGDGNGNYGWNKCITREATARVLYNALSKAGLLEKIKE
jgi:N-acetylmuramoyl-L-alanine amidase